jgi:hypothetical protein
VTWCQYITQCKTFCTECVHGCAGDEIAVLDRRNEQLSTVEQRLARALDSHAKAMARAMEQHAQVQPHVLCTWLLLSCSSLLR